MFDTSADPKKFEEALAFFREKLPLTKDQFDQLEAQLRIYAFTIAKISQLDLINDVFKALQAISESGLTFSEFKKRYTDTLGAAWGKGKKYTGWRMENIYRTNAQSQFSAGRYAQQEEVAGVRPYLMFDAVLDGNTSEICRGCNGVIRARNDPYWNNHIPPLHYQCRSAVRSLSTSEAQRRGITGALPSEQPLEGFGTRPDPTYRHDFSKYPADLLAIHDSKT